MSLTGRDREIRRIRSPGYPSGSPGLRRAAVPSRTASGPGRGRSGRAVPRHEWVPGAPRPGDPAAGGPRPPARVRDVVWSLLGAVLVAVTVVQSGRLAVTLATSPDVDLSGIGVVVGIVVTIAWYLIVYWVTAGAWRRTVWGCPFAHTADAPWERRCQRHRLLPARDGAEGRADAGTEGRADATG